MQKMYKCISYSNLWLKFLFLFQAKFLDFKIQNMVGSCDVKFPIRLEGLVLTHGQFSRYTAADVLQDIASLLSAVASFT